MSDAGIRSRPIRPEDIPAVVSLFHEAFGRTITPEHYAWKLRTRPSPGENVAIAVDEDDRPVFHSAGIPCRCRIAGVERWVMLGVDVMTAPRYRRLGLHTRHSNDLYARWKAAGIAAVIGFTSELWGTTAKKVGLRPLGPLESMSLPLYPERILARKTGIAALGRLGVIGGAWRRLALGAATAGDCEIGEVRQAGEDFDRLWSIAGRGIERSLVRDREWVAWRYLASPTIRYRVLLGRRRGAPVGYAAVREPEHHVATIAEIFTAPGDGTTFRALVRAATMLALDEGAESVRTLAVPGSWPYHGFRRSRFFRRSPGVIQYIPLDPSISHEMGAASDWYFTAGDFDAV